MNYKITFTGNSPRDSYTSYTPTYAHALCVMVRRALGGYASKITKVVM